MKVFAVVFLLDGFLCSERTYKNRRPFAKEFKIRRRIPKMAENTVIPNGTLRIGLF